MLLCAVVRPEEWSECVADTLPELCNTTFLGMGYNDEMILKIALYIKRHWTYTVFFFFAMLHFFKPQDATVFACPEHSHPWGDWRGDRWTDQGMKVCKCWLNCVPVLNQRYWHAPCCFLGSCPGSGRSPGRGSGPAAGWLSPGEWGLSDILRCLRALHTGGIGQAPWR